MTQEKNKVTALSELFVDMPKKYQRGSFDIRKNQDLVIEMILNNMKIEGQEISKKTFIESLNESNTSQ